MIPKVAKVPLPEEVPSFCILYWRVVHKRHGLTIPALCLYYSLITGTTGKDLAPQELKKIAKTVISHATAISPKKLANKYKVVWPWNWNGFEISKCTGISEWVMGYIGSGHGKKTIDEIIETYDWNSSTKENGKWQGVDKSARDFAKKIAGWMNSVRCSAAQKSS